MNALQQSELEELNEFVERERFQIETIDQVNWALRKLSAIKAKHDEIKQLADAEIARISAWHEAESRKLDDDKFFFESLLQEYMHVQRINDPNFKKASTPYGTVKFRKSQPKWEYDDFKLLESLKSAGRTDLIRIKEEPNKVELKKAVQVVGEQVVDPESGAVIEGVSVIERGDEVVVEVL